MAKDGGGGANGRRKVAEEASPGYHLPGDVVAHTTMLEVRVPLLNPKPQLSLRKGTGYPWFGFDAVRPCPLTIVLSRRTARCTHPHGRFLVCYVVALGILSCAVPSSSVEHLAATCTDSSAT